MPKIKLILEDVKILDNEYNAPNKLKQKNGNDFCIFFITYTQKIKDSENHKFLRVQCLLFNEWQIKRFFEQYDPTQTNRITITDCYLTDFSVEKFKQTNLSGKEYDKDFYCDIKVAVNSFVIKQTPKDTYTQIKHATHEVSDAIPF